MFEDFFRNIMFGERSTVTTDRQEKSIITPDDSNKSVMRVDNEKPTTILDPELELLVEKFGPLKKGQTIELTLQEALQVWPRERKKSDAYKSLIRKVKEQFNVELKIGGKRNG